MHLLHLGAHRLNTAQDLVLVRDGGDADPRQVAVESKRRGRRGLRTTGSNAGAQENMRVNHKQQSKSEADVQKWLNK